MADSFAAPWSRSLAVISGGTTLLLLSVAFVVARAVGAEPGIVRLLALGGPLALLFGGLLFTVRGYEIAGRTLRIRRLLWSTEVRLEGLRSVRVDPEAMKHSLRLFGNGGLFSFTGLFSNKRLGRYRAFVTAPARAVVLTWTGRTVVVSPDRPEEFARSLRHRWGLDEAQAGAIEPG